MKSLHIALLTLPLIIATSCTPGVIIPKEKPFIFNAKNIEDTALIAVMDRENPNLKYASVNAIDRNNLYYITISSRPTISGESYTVIVNDKGDILAYSKGGYRTTPPTPAEIEAEKAKKIAKYAPKKS